MRPPFNKWTIQVYTETQVLSTVQPSLLVPSLTRPEIRPNGSQQQGFQEFDPGLTPWSTRYKYLGS